MSYTRWLGHAEIVMESYYQSRKQIQQMEAELITAKGKRDGQPHGGGISDPTAAAAIRINTGRLAELKAEVKAVETVRKKIMDSDDTGIVTELMNYLYFKRRLPLFAACDLLDISYRTGKRYKKRILVLLAKELGWI